MRAARALATARLQQLHSPFRPERVNTGARGFARKGSNSRFHRNASEKASLHLQIRTVSALTEIDESSQDKGREATGQPRDYTPWVTKPYFDANVSTETAAAAYTDVLADVGANVPALDDHDKRVIQEAHDGTTHYKGSKTGLPGLPDTEDDVGGYESYPTVTRPSAAEAEHHNTGTPSSSSP